MSALALAYKVQPVKTQSTTTIVPDDYPTIQAAINAASPGDTIHVRNGTYNEDVIVNRTGLHVVGESTNGTIVDASGLDPAEGPRAAFYVDADLVEVTSFLLRCTDGSGVVLMGPNCCVSGNRIIDTNWGIVSTMLSDNASITNNMIYAFDRGIHLNDTRVNIVEGNVIAGSTDGVFSNDLAIGQGNVVTDNTIMSNENGVILFQTRANATMFYHNNFVGNTYQVNIPGTIQPTTWDDGYPSGGNYWSDYTGTDLYHGPFQNETGSDGMGDTKYHIIWSNIVNLTDNYPLMGNFSRLQSDATPAFIPSCISNSTVTGFQSHGATISFDVSGQPGTAGFCTLTILHSTLAPPYTVQVNGSSVPYATVFENDTLSTIYFTYQHSTHEVTIASVDWWPMFRYDLSHTGYSTSKAPNTNNTIWTYTTGNWLYSSPAVADGRVYIGSKDAKVYCLNASTGAFIWSYTTGNCVESSPAVADGRVYVGSIDGKVYCLNASTGEFIWSYVTYNTFSSPAITDGKVYIGSSGGGKVYCLNASTGEFIWGYITVNGENSSPAVADGRVYIGSMDGKVYCLNASTGAFIWRFTTGTTDEVFSSPAVVDGKVYVGSRDYKVYCLNASTGEFIWNFTTGNLVYSSPAVADDRVYIGSHDTKVYCLNASTGIEIWSYTTGGLVVSSPAVADGKVYVGSYDKKVHCLDASTGIEIWSYTTGDIIITSSPAVADGKVYVGSFDYKVYAFGSHDIAITNVTASKTFVGQNYSVSASVTAINQGSFTETFNVTAYANETVIATFTDIVLSGGAPTTLTFSWNTTDCAKGNYTLSAYAWPVENETDIDNNNFTGGWVKITIVGDVNGDGKVNLVDVFKVALAYGSVSGDSRWDPNLDINNDGKINLIDYFTAALNYGKTDA